MIFIFNQVNTYCLNGVESFPVIVEADVSDGLPCFNMVGVLGSSLKEAHERVRTAIKNTGIRIPPKRITINLAPASLRKDGTSLDLAIAAAIISCLEVDINRDIFNESAFIGELGLEGIVKPVSGILSMTMCAKENDIKRIFIPEDNVEEAGLIQGIDIVPVSTLSQLTEYLLNPERIKLYEPENHSFNCDFYNSEDDFADINGLSTVKKACETAAAGHHNILFIGPAGTGKTMAARRMESLLTPMSFEECLETTKIYSIAGLLKKEHSIITRRPFRAPHQTITSVSMTGGGKYPQPGEISLASNGCLFLDELAEFNPQVIDLLRQPMEDGMITVSRLNGTVTFPAKIMVIAAMNPCKCGQYPSEICNCSQVSRSRYLNRISGPFRDRIDIGIEVPIQDFNTADSDSTSDMRRRIIIADEIQKERYRNLDINYNSELTKDYLDEFCELSEADVMFLDRISKKYKLSYRSRNKLLKVARTIADLQESKRIRRAHITEAAAYRSYEQKYWGNKITY